MHVVLGATLCIFINIIHTNTQYTTYTTTITTTTTTTTNDASNTSATNVTELERSMKETETILEELEKAIEEAKVLVKDKNITFDVHDIDYYKEDYRNFLSKLLGNSTHRSDNNSQAAGDTQEDARAGGNHLTPARRHKELKLHLFDFVSLTGKKKKHKDAEREMNRIIMQGKIDEWLLNRELEKKKIKSYIDRVRVAKLEKCYRQGISRKKKRKKTRRQNGDNNNGKNGEETDRKKKKKKKKNSKYKGGDMYPCCRKCCKRSYMGCL